jgi:hypothetical protein
MSSIWIILLDVSGSMDEGFSGAPSQDPLAEVGLWRTKLEAAKDLLLRQIAATRVQDIAVFSFAERCDLVFHGARSEFPKAEASIRALQADGQTNLAGALTAVTENVTFERYQSLSVLILSDGLANVGDPVAAALQLISKYPFARIDTILIDYTEEGQRIAESVSINGSVRSAFSLIQLGEAVESAQISSLRNELGGFAERRLQLESELSRIANLPAPTLLTVTSPLYLTASSLRNEVAPLVEGLETFERVACDASGTPYRGAITSISRNSPVSISLSGLREAVELLLEWVIPWRRENAKRIHELRIRQAELELRQKEIEIDTLDVRLDRERAEVEKALLENRHLEVSIASSKLELAERMLRDLDPNESLGGQHRRVLLQELVKGIDRITDTSIELSASGPGLHQDTGPLRQ